jgi:hypothetical protein
MGLTPTNVIDISPFPNVMWVWSTNEKDTCVSCPQCFSFTSNKDVDINENIVNAIWRKGICKLMISLKNVKICRAIEIDRAIQISHQCCIF